MRIPTLVAISALLVGWQAPASAETPIGQAVRAIEMVHASRDTERRSVSKNDPVFANELVETGDDSYAGLIFKDETSLAIGPNANVLLDEFVYDADTKVGTMVVTIAKGAMRFVTGKQARQSYRLRTPVGTIGIRGTIIAVFVNSLGQMTVFVQQGIATFTNLAGQTQVLSAGQSLTFSSATPGAPATPTGPPGPLPPGLESTLQGMIDIQPPPISAGGVPPGAPGVVVVSLGNVSVSNITTALAAAQGTGVPAGTAASQAAVGGLGPVTLTTLAIGGLVAILVGVGIGGGGGETTTTTGP